MRSSSASWWRGQHEEAALAEELVLASGHDTRAALAAVVGFVLVFFFVLEADLRGAFPQHHVEGLLDVVGVEFLVEVDDVVVFFLGGLFLGLGGGRGRGLLGVDDEVAALVCFLEVVVDQRIVVVIVEVVVLFERRLVDVSRRARVPLRTRRHSSGCAWLCMLSHYGSRSRAGASRRA